MCALYCLSLLDANIFNGSFGELCLLIPSTDIDIVVFGPSVYKISQNAKPSSIAARKYAYKYCGPDQCGSGSIRIQLYKEAAMCDPNEIITYHAR
jgi:hypothetical protein